MEKTTRKIWGQKTLLLVTGASQGIGETIAVEFSRIISPSSVVLLMARSLSGLNKTKDFITTASPGVSVEVITCDLSNPDTVDMKRTLEKYGKETFDISILVHNAGSEGSCASTQQMTDLKEWQSFMALNMYSVAMLTGVFVKEVQAAHKVILNITSLAALQPFPSMGFYSVSRSAREMYMRALAEENPNLDVLNYSPGPVATEMIDRLLKKLPNEKTREGFETMQAQGTLIKREDTIAKLIQVLDAGNYQSGKRVDYYEL